MLTTPMDVLQHFPVRKSKAQKQAFRDAVQTFVSELGYECTVEKGSMGSRNLVIGNPKNAAYLVTAHYDTCARMFLPNMITPCNFIFYILYQLFVIMLLVIPSIAAGVLFSFLPECKDYSGTAGLAVYWTLLALMMFGPANPNNANDNTSGVVTLLEIARSLPENQRSKVCFVLFDLEEAGLIGSKSYRKVHKKETNNQLIINLDCVGDGDHILMFPTKKLKKDKTKFNPLYSCCGYFGNKSILVRDKGISIYPSDQSNFPYGIGVAAFHKGKAGLYLNRIHTKKDTVLEETNVNILRAAIISLICCHAAQ